MRLVRLIQNNLYAVVEDVVHECVAKVDNKEVYEHFQKTWLIETRELPEDLISEYNRSLEA